MFLAVCEDATAKRKAGQALLDVLVDRWDRYPAKAFAGASPTSSLDRGDDPVTEGSTISVNDPPPGFLWPPPPAARYDGVMKTRTSPATPVTAAAALGAVAILPIIYAFSIGPAFWLCNTYNVPKASQIDRLYRPLFWVTSHTGTSKYRRAYSPASAQTPPPRG